MHLMVWLRIICLGGDTKGDMPFTHLTLRYVFLSLLYWNLKSLPLGHRIKILPQIWLIFFLRLVLVLSSNILKRCILSWGVYIPYLPIHIIGSSFFVPYLLIGDINRLAQLTQGWTCHQSVFCHSELGGITDGEQIFVVFDASSYANSLLSICRYTKATLEPYFG